MGSLNSRAIPICVSNHALGLDMPGSPSACFSIGACNLRRRQGPEQLVKIAANTSTALLPLRICPLMLRLRPIRCNFALSFWPQWTSRPAPRTAAYSTALAVLSVQQHASIVRAIYHHIYGWVEHQLQCQIPVSDSV